MRATVLWAALLMFGATACTKTAVLKEDDPLRVSASPPKPPPPPPPPKRVEVKKEKIQVNEKIHFEFNRAQIREESHNLLDEIAQVILDHPEVLQIRIEGHTDNVGSHAYNLDLSKRRAKAVYDYLIEKGVEEERLVTEGYSFDQPIADNETEEGRAQNRRVEFNILERAEEGETVAEEAGGQEDTTATDAGDADEEAAGGGDEDTATDDEDTATDDEAAATDGEDTDATDAEESGEEGAGR